MASERSPRPPPQKYTPLISLRFDQHKTKPTVDDLQKKDSASGPPKRTVTTDVGSKQHNKCK